MESQSILFTSLLLCGITVFYLYLQFQLKRRQEGRNSQGGPMSPGLELAASLHPSPGVKVHLLRWRSATDAQQGEFLLVTAGPTIQVTPCRASWPEPDVNQPNCPKQQDENHSLSYSATHR